VIVYPVRPAATAVPLAKNPAGTAIMKVFTALHKGLGISLEVVNVIVAAVAVLTTRFAKGMVIETAEMVPFAIPTMPVAEQVVV